MSERIGVGTQQHRNRLDGQQTNVQLHRHLKQLILEYTFLRRADTGECIYSLQFAGLTYTVFQHWSPTPTTVPDTFKWISYYSSFNVAKMHSYYRCCCLKMHSKQRMQIQRSISETKTSKKNQCHAIMLY